MERGKSLARALSVGALAIMLLGGRFAVDGRDAPLAQPPTQGAQVESSERPLALAEPVEVRGPVRCELKISGGYRSCLFTGAVGQSLPFLLHEPESYTPQQKYPLVLLLHGLGERAAPGMTIEEGRALLMGHRYVTVWAGEAQTRCRSFVVVPQLTEPNRWVNVLGANGSYNLAPEPTAGLLMAKGIVDVLQRDYAGVDAERLHITGISSGGFGTWDAIARWPGYFAAAVPVAGAGDPSRGTALANVPLWAFHGAADTVVPVSGSREMIAAIRAAGGKPSFTEFAGGGHDDDIWDRAYAAGETEGAPDLFGWIAKQTRVKPG